MKRIIVGSLLWIALAGALAYSATNQEPAAINGCIYSANAFTLANKQHASFSCDVNGKLMTTGG